MFLKKEEVTILGTVVVIYELSALQRAEYFEYLANLESAISVDASEVKQLALSVKTNVQVNAWLVSRSLSNAEPDRDVDVINKEVLRNWSSEALNQAVGLVLSLSNMNPKEPETSDVTPERDADAEFEGKKESKPLAK